MGNKLRHEAFHSRLDNDRHSLRQLDPKLDRRRLHLHQHLFPFSDQKGIDLPLAPPMGKWTS